MLNANHIIILVPSADKSLTSEPLFIKLLVLHYKCDFKWINISEAQLITALHFKQALGDW